MKRRAFLRRAGLALLAAPALLAAKTSALVPRSPATEPGVPDEPAAPAAVDAPAPQELKLPDLGSNREIKLADLVDDKTLGDCKSPPYWEFNPGPCGYPGSTGAIDFKLRDPIHLSGNSGTINISDAFTGTARYFEELSRSAIEAHANAEKFNKAMHVLRSRLGDSYKDHVWDMIKNGPTA